VPRTYWMGGDCSPGMGISAKLFDFWSWYSVGLKRSGMIGPDRLQRIRLVAASAPPGLEPSALPSTAQIPNNHRFYAIQWFAFAAIALVIYILALRKRFRAG